MSSASLLRVVIKASSSGGASLYWQLCLMTVLPALSCLASIVLAALFDAVLPALFCLASIVLAALFDGCSACTVLSC